MIWLTRTQGIFWADLRFLSAPSSEATQYAGVSECLRSSRGNRLPAHGGYRSQTVGLPMGVKKICIRQIGRVRLRPSDYYCNVGARRSTSSLTSKTRIVGCRLVPACAISEPPIRSCWQDRYPESDGKDVIEVTIDSRYSIWILAVLH